MGAYESPALLLFIYFLIDWLIDWLINQSIYLFIYLFTYLFIYLNIYLFIHLLTYLFIFLFILLIILVWFFSISSFQLFFYKKHLNKTNCFCHDNKTSWLEIWSNSKNFNRRHKISVHFGILWNFYVAN